MQIFRFPWRVYTHAANQMSDLQRINKFSNDYYRFLAHEISYRREISFFSFVSIFLIDLTQRGYVRHLYISYLLILSLSLSLSISEKVNKYEAKQVNMRENLKYV